MMFAAGRQIEVPLTDFYYRGFFVFPAVRGEKAFNRLSWGGGWTHMLAIKRLRDNLFGSRQAL